VSSTAVREGGSSAERDRLLLLRMAAGDRESLAELYDHLAPTVLGILVRLVRRRDLAEEVLQETFLQAWLQAGAYRPELESPGAWLLAIARSRGVECLHREALRKRTVPSARSSTTDLPLLGHRILIVYHDVDFLTVLGLVLQQLGAKVYEVTSAPKALESLQSQRPDLLISDLRMAGMDGFALLEAVRALPESLGGRTPAIALSGAPASEVVPRVLSSGFQVFLPKPLNENDLLSAVPALVGRGYAQAG
jgi:CheY-like chemotaxis protein